MSRKLGIIMDPIERVKYHKDTSLALLWAAKEKGWELWYMEIPDLYQANNRAMAMASPLRVFQDENKWFERDSAEAIALGELDVILMRKDPPFDTAFLTSTWFLEQAEQEGCLIVNNPQALRDCNEKYFATLFPDCTPPLTIACREAPLKAFLAEHKDCIFKPLDGMGGSGIFRVKEGDPNVSVIIESLTHLGTRHIMAQAYLPEITKGDKRILMVNGKPIPYALARIPSSGETRGNLAAGGKGVAQPLSDRDREIAERVGPELVKRGLWFVGLDVIGDHLTEINVTSPTCVREINNQYGTDIGKTLMDALEHALEGKV